MHDRGPAGEGRGGHGESGVALVGVEVGRARAELLAETQGVAARGLAAVVDRSRDLGDVRATRSGSAPYPLVASSSEEVGISSWRGSRVHDDATHSAVLDQDVGQPGGHHQLDLRMPPRGPDQVLEHGATGAARDGVAALAAVTGVVEVRDQGQGQTDTVGQPLDQGRADLGQSVGEYVVGLAARLRHDVPDELRGAVVDPCLALPAGTGSGDHRGGHRGVVALGEVLVDLDDEHVQPELGRTQGAGQAAAGTGDDQVGPVVAHAADPPSWARTPSRRRARAVGSTTTVAATGSPRSTAEHAFRAKSQSSFPA